MTQTDLQATEQVDHKTDLLGMDMAGLAEFFTQIGEKPFRAAQVMKWIHQFGVSDFDEMTNLSKALREKLKQKAVIRTPKIVSEQRSEDGTIKWLLEVDNHNSVETVFIPEKHAVPCVFHLRSAVRWNAAFVPPVSKGLTVTWKTGKSLRKCGLPTRRWAASRKKNALFPMSCYGMGSRY